MVYIYDVLLNWDKEKLYDFFEWEKTDILDHIRKIPLYRVSKELINDILRFNVKLDSNVISKIYNMTESYTSKKLNKIPYAVILCDGARAIAIKTDKEGNIKYRSKLLIDEEEEVINLTNRLMNLNIEYAKKDELIIKKLITRDEEKIANHLKLEINECYKNKKFDKLKYLYKEYSDKTNDNPKIIYNDLIKSLDDSINEKHKHLYSLLQMITNKS